MADQKKTIFQSLESVLDPFGGTASPDRDKQRIIIKGKSPEDIKRRALEIEQQQELNKKFTKLNDHGFQKAMQYEAARLPAYLDYEGMEYYPLIASALDLFMEEATTIDKDGQMLKINSDKERIKQHLDEFFYDIVNINVNLPFWTRNLCKYGDNFVYLKGKKKSGITHVKQMVNYEMERIERVKDSKSQVYFQQRETSQQFKLLEIAHFRLLGDDKYLPYGSSILNKIRRAFRQLIMAEDSMLTYRITRAGEKRVFNIDVGNMDEDDIQEYMGKVISGFKKKQNVYPDSGQIDYRYNILGVDEDYFMPKRNGSNVSSIETLPGAQNLDQIADIQYLRDNLFTGLGVPKPFLGFQEAAGDGKNMAQMDIRFAKKVNRIQQAIIQELNKMAMIHLYLLGFEEDYQNFSLSLTNPSTQQEMLMNEMMQSKTQIYTEITRNEGGIAAMSHTNAKRLLFNMSDEEIINDFKIQRMERALSQELQDSPLVIPKTGVFKDLDDKYGSDEAMPQGAPEGQEGMEGTDEPNMPPAGGGDENAPQSPSELPPIESVNLTKPKMDDNQYGSLLEKMVKTTSKPKIVRKKKDEDREVINENVDKVKGSNVRAIKMAGEIESLLNKGSINNDEALREAVNGERLQKLIDENMTKITKFHVENDKKEDQSKEKDK